MKRVVFVTSGIASIRNANLEFARRLTEAGFVVIYASPSNIEDAIESRGLPFIHLGDGRSGTVPSRRSLLARIGRLPFLGMRRRAEVDGSGVERAIATLAALCPDLVLIDLELHPYVIGSSGLGLPTALVSTWLAMWRRPGLAPLHRYVLPASGWRGSFTVEWAWLRYRLWKLARRRLDWLRRAGTDRVSVLRTLAGRTGFSFRAETDMWQWPFPFSYRRLPLLLLNALELDLPHQPPLNVRYVGPMISEPEPGDPSDPVEQLLAERARQGGTRPLIYIAFGAFFKGDDTPFVRRVLEAVEGRMDWEVVLALGGRMSPEAFGPRPPHVHIFSWVPQARLISQAAVAVLHGGITSINECLWFGVPMLVYPLKTNDQMGTAVRVEHHGLGIVADRDADESADIRSRIDRVLSNREFGERARAMKDRFRAYDREGVGVAAVEDLINSG